MSRVLARDIGLTALSAALGALAFEPFSWWPLALFAWIPFLFVLESASPRSAFYLGLMHGLLLYGSTLSWMWNIFGSVAAVLWSILAFFTALTALMTALLPNRRAIGKALLTAAVWSGVEFVRAELFVLSFPWITPGTALPPNWFSPVVGVYGVTFLIVLGSALVIRKRVTGVCVLLSLPFAVMTFPGHPNRSTPFRSD